jgi:probable F420-dependent oxidoreductase
MRRWGLTVPPAGIRLAAMRARVERAEAAGYTDLWSSETAGADGFTPLSLCAGWAEEMRLGTGIVGIFQRGPALLAQEAAALTDASEGRFVLGLGVSSDRIVEGWNGIPFDRPLAKMRQTLDFLDLALAGERTAGGSKLEPEPVHPTPVMLAALRGKMLELAVERAAGAFTNYLPLSGLPLVREALKGAAPDFELLCRFFCFPGTREEVEPTMRRLFAAYVTVPVYREFFHWLGFGEQIAPMVDLWGTGDRKGAAAAAPWELIADTFPFGSPEEIVERVEAFVEGGVTLPILLPMVEPERTSQAIADLAPRGS